MKHSVMMDMTSGAGYVGVSRVKHGVGQKRGATMMKEFVLASAACAALMLAACGDGGGAAAVSVDPEGDAISAENGLATAAQVAAQKRGNVSCPARVTPPAAGAPVDDIVGVRPGMTYDEAANIVLCDNPMIVVEEETYRGFQIDTRGQTYRKGFNAQFAEREKTSQEIMAEMQDNMMARSMNAVREDMKPGMTRWYVATMGQQGQERVLHVAREEWYAEGKNPPVDGVAQALIGKYGQPSQDQSGDRYRMMSWKYDLQNRPVTDTSPLYNRCNLGAGPDAGASLSPDCGVIVSAQITFQNDNPALARSLEVGSVNSSGGYQILEETEQAFIAADEARKQQELQDATKNATAPKL